MSGRQWAVRRWRQAQEIAGEGEVALVMWCPPLTVWLYETHEAAAEGQRQMERCGCFSGCVRNHEIIKKGQRRSVWEDRAR